MEKRLEKIRCLIFIFISKQKNSISLSTDLFICYFLLCFCSHIAAATAAIQLFISIRYEKEILLQAVNESSLISHDVNTTMIIKVMFTSY